MRVLVTGSRKHTDASMTMALIEELHRLDAPTGKALTIIHGDAKGADKVATVVAARWGANCYVFPAEWGVYGKHAGRMRNAEMLSLRPDVVLAFPLAGSVGTWDCVTQAHKHDVPVVVRNV
jgi:hypothetical protein